MRQAIAAARTVGSSAVLSRSIFVLVWACLGACSSLPSYDGVVQRLGAGTFVEVDDVDVYVETFGDAESGTPVILVHGYGASTVAWRQVIPALAERHQVVAVDLVGFGLTERPHDLDRYSRTGQVEVLSALVDHFGWSSAHFMGHSYGGGLVMSLAHLEPAKVRSITLIGSSAPVYSDKRRNFFGRQPFASLLVRAFLRPKYVGRSLKRSFYDDRAVTQEVIATYLERLRVEGAVRAFIGLTAPAQPDPRFDDLTYESLKQPTLAIWGSNDVLIPPEEARHAIEALPNARFVELAECGHLPMEEKPGELVAEALPFLAEQDAGTATKDREESGNLALQLECLRCSPEDYPRTTSSRPTDPSPISD